MPRLDQRARFLRRRLVKTRARAVAGTGRLRQARSGHLGDAGDRRQHLGLSGQLLFGRDQLRDIRVQGLDLPADLVQPILDLKLQQVVRASVGPAPPCGPSPARQPVPRRALGQSYESVPVS